MLRVRPLNPLHCSPHFEDEDTREQGEVKCSPEVTHESVMAPGLEPGQGWLQTPGSKAARPSATTRSVFQVSLKGRVYFDSSLPFANYIRSHVWKPELTGSVFLVYSCDLLAPFIDW